MTSNIFYSLDLWPKIGLHTKRWYSLILQLNSLLLNPPVIIVFKEIMKLCNMVDFSCTYRVVALRVDPLKETKSPKYLSLMTMSSNP